MKMTLHVYGTSKVMGPFDVSSVEEAKTRLTDLKNQPNASKLQLYVKVKDGRKTVAHILDNGQIL